MNLIIVVIITIAIICLLGYGIKFYFEAKRNRSLETSNSPIVRAITVISVGFLTLIGFSTIIPALFIEFLNQSLGLELKAGTNNEFFSASMYVLFCCTIITLVYFYYQKRHKLYISKTPNFSRNETHKNQVNRSKISAKRVDVGDKFIIKNEETIGKQINIEKNSGTINF